ncbi:hypothetical protein P6U16_08680 [Rhizobium sp. 32-5/1]|uniref:hypothetical protein n=1 Tax=Rhizobium sp. 32-5/1 TaxID=3019602 RepID=UPI00240D2522|nr:hypothetical protein [Rhizobium sp. 32-5/1]WEZ84630.1 hypothetical protein P6U16_08680 [Rhizobium sp. 32-5/1]
MSAFILILGILQMLGVIAVALGAKSAIHEILACAFGLGAITFALAIITAKVDDALKARNA